MHFIKNLHVSYFFFISSLGFYVRKGNSKLETETIYHLFSLHPDSTQHTEITVFRPFENLHMQNYLQCAIIYCNMIIYNQKKHHSMLYRESKTIVTLKRAALRVELCFR